MVLQYVRDGSRAEIRHSGLDCAGGMIGCGTNPMCILWRSQYGLPVLLLAWPLWKIWLTCAGWLRDLDVDSIRLPQLGYFPSPVGTQREVERWTRSSRQSMTDNEYTRNRVGKAEKSKPRMLVSRFVDVILEVGRNMLFALLRVLDKIPVQE